jgi:hypothetical protein
MLGSFRFDKEEQPKICFSFQGTKDMSMVMEDMFAIHKCPGVILLVSLHTHFWTFVMEFLWKIKLFLQTLPQLRQCLDSYLKCKKSKIEAPTSDYSPKF